MPVKGMVSEAEPKRVDGGLGKRKQGIAQGPRTAEPFEFLFLKHTQQLGLQIERNVFNFVEKDCSLVRKLEAPDASIDSASERAFLVAE